MKTEQEKIKEIENMSHLELARIWRFAPPGDEMLDMTKPYSKIIEQRLFKEFDGFIPAISKALGW